MSKPDLLDEFCGDTSNEHQEQMHKCMLLMLTNENPYPIQNCMKSILCEWVEMKLGGEYSIMSNDKMIQVHRGEIWYQNISWSNAHLLLELINEKND